MIGFAPAQMAAQSIGMTVKRQALSRTIRHSPGDLQPTVRRRKFKPSTDRNLLARQGRFVQKFWAVDAQNGDKRSDFRYGHFHKKGDWIGPFDRHP